MKKTFITLTALMLCAATFANAQKVSPQKSPATFEDSPSRTFHGCTFDHIKDSIGKDVVIAGTVKSDKKQGNTRVVKLGATYTNKLFTVILEGRAAKVIENTDGKLASVSGKLIKRNGEPIMVINEPVLFSRNNKPKNKKLLFHAG